MYSLGDRFVSQKYIHSLSNNSNIEEISIDSCNHNPLLNNENAVKYVKKYLNK